VGRDADLVTRVRDARRSLASNGPSELRCAGDFERISLPDAEADVLRDLLAAERPTTVIEIGLAYGSSALAIAEALVATGQDAARHIIVDAHQDEFHNAGWHAIVDAGLGDVCSLIRERSQLALARLVDDGIKADAAFVDGSHIFHNVFVDLFYLSELVRPGGLVIMDDCTKPSVAAAASYFVVNAGWRREPTKRRTRLQNFRLPDPTRPSSAESFTPFWMEASP